ncbi:DNA internalization-related competence protein ComEC/Rec2 [Acinetobacter nectaris]|nr:DNA internalization-related competence protein ComEC/Rec2 [Acinetobacter nectaris]
MWALILCILIMSGMLYTALIAWVLGHAYIGSPIIEPISYTQLLAIAFIALCIFIPIGCGLNSLKSYQKFVFQVSISLTIAVISFLFAQTHAHNALQERLKNRILAKDTVKVLVYIQKMDQLKEQSIQQDIQVFTLDSNGAWRDWRTSFSLKKYKENPLKLGHYYWLEGQVDKIHGYATPYAFDKEKWLIAQNIMGTLRITNIQEADEHILKQDYRYKLFVQEQNHWFSLWQLAIEKKRLQYRHFIEQQLFKHSGLLLALLTGDESLITSHTQEQFQHLGISHLLAISGPHILIFAGFITFLIQGVIYFLFPNLYLKYPRKYVLAIPFLLGVSFYCAFVGFEIPAIRTLITVVIFTLFLFLKQKVSAFFTILFSASVMLWLDALNILSAAFWLSYGACFVLIRIYQITEQRSQISWFKRIFKPFVSSQWQIFIALFPITLIFFHQISWFAPFTNLIAIPLLGGIVVPLIIFAACLFNVVPAIGFYCFKIADWVLGVFSKILMHLEKLPLATAYIPLNIWQIALCAMGILILFLPKRTLPKFWALVCFLPCMLPVKQDRDFEFNVLDVGQGQSIFIRHYDYNMLVDTGGHFNESNFSLAKSILLPFLMKNGVADLDQVLLSHLDQDHSGAFSVLKQNMPIKHVMSNHEPSDLEGIKKFAYCHEGQFIHYDRLKVQILSPNLDGLQHIEKSANEYSCVVYLSYENENKKRLNFLIMADVGNETEQRLMKEYPNLPVDILVLGHHGSKNSSSEAFLRHYQPQIAIASAGYNNRYGHPHTDVINRLEKLSIPLWITSETGAIQMTLQQNGRIESQFYRDSKVWLRYRK